MMELSKPKATETDEEKRIREAILKDESFVKSYLAQSIELTETALNTGVDRKLLEELLTLDLVQEDDKAPRSLTEEEENEFFALLQAPGQGKAITNMAEYLLMTECMR